MHGCLECIRRRQRVEINILTGTDGGDAVVTWLEMVHGVEGAADLEAEDLLGVLTLEIDLIAELSAEDGREEEVSLPDDVSVFFK